MDAGLRITVAGAGALGLSCALALADRGARVTVCDPAKPLDNASGVAAGMLAPAFEAALDAIAGPHFALLLAARDLWPAMAERIGLPLDLRGAVGVGRAAWLNEIDGRLAEMGVATEALGVDNLEALAPGLRADGAFLVKDDWRIDAPAALAALRRAAAEAGVTFRAEAVSGQAAADLLVVATGAAGDLAPELGVLQPIKGHILGLSGVSYQGLTVRGEGIYAAPGLQGPVLGATMEAGRMDRSVDPAQVEQLMTRGVSLFPDWRGAAVRAQTGVRAATPDGLPLAGFSNTPRLLIAAGARRNGWLLAPLVARLVADLAYGRDAGPYAAALDPRRFT